MPKIYLYAEILTHIRQLTLHASLQTDKYEGAKLEVTTDKKVISVTHDGETQKLYLPTQIKGDATVTFPLLKTTDISARVQIEDEHEWKCMISNEIESPWLAPHLTEDTAIRCRNCKASILPTGKVSHWKDLPSENWAEMMEVWFCHKPHHDDHDEHNNSATEKGFSSTSRLAVESGTGMTDLVSIVLCARDCKNIKASETRKRPDVTVLRCEKCLEMLGIADQSEALVRLHKSSITLSVAASNWQTYPAAIFICSQILSMIETTALKKFVVYSTATENDLTGERTEATPLIIWAFNPDIYYSCSAYSGNEHLTKPAATMSGESREVSKDEPTTEEEIEGVATGDDASGLYKQRETPAKMQGSALTAPEVGTAVKNEHINLVHRAAKIFYKELPSDVSATEFLDEQANATSYEELYLHNPADLVALRKTLETTTSILPASAREFQDWHVGLLDRYETVPSGLGVMAENPLARGIEAKDGRVTRWDIGNGAEGLYA